MIVARPGSIDSSMPENVLKRRPQRNTVGFTGRSVWLDRVLKSYV